MRVRRVVLGLLAGLIIGSVIAGSQNAVALRVALLLEPIGTIWVNAIRMTIVPLVISLLFVSIAGRDTSGGLGKLGLVTIGTFFGLLVFAATVALLIGPALIDDLKLAPETVSALRFTATAGAAQTRAQIQQVPGFASWLAGLIPANAIKAAADGAMLPLIVFTALLALAARRIDPTLRDALLSFFRAVASATRTIVDWIIAAAPIGIFALVVVAASRVGVALAGAMGYYIVAMSATLVLFALLLYPVAVSVGAISLPLFTRAVLPAQTVALGTSSSLASLPALVDGGRALALPATATGFVLPLAVATFKVATPITWGIGTLFLAKLYGITLSTGAQLSIAATAVALSLSLPGIPQGALLLLAPVLVTYGIPAEGLALLLAADTIPDLVGTMTNVTGDLAAAVIAARVAGEDMLGEAAAGAEPELALEASRRQELDRLQRT